MLRMDNCISLNGNISSRDDEIKILVSGIYELVENSNYIPKAEVEIKSQSAKEPKTRKLFLRLPTIECEISKKAQNLLEIFEGGTEAMFYAADTKSYSRFNGRVEVSEFLIKELKTLLGDENVVFR